MRIGPLLLLSVLSCLLQAPIPRMTLLSACEAIKRSPRVRPNACGGL